MRTSQVPLLSRLIAYLFLLAASALSAPAAAQTINHVAAELIAEGPAEPGETLMLALHFKPESGWHGYWSNPGDAGYGMQFNWGLPDGWKASEPLYPVPQKLMISGLMNHVYEGEYAVLVPVSVPQNVASGTVAPVELELNWLACTDEICVPERATLATRVTVGGKAPKDARFDAWRSALPPPLDRKGRFELTEATLRVSVPLPASLALNDPHVFLDQEQLVDYAGLQKFSRKGNWLIAELPREGTAGGAENISGILKLNVAGGVRFDALPGAVPSGGTELGSGEQELAPLLLLLGLALLGGLILNVLPCVFPILSLKALSLARASGSEAAARREGLGYTAGVMLACLALGGLLLALRAAGHQIGWAFQLQEPGVVVALAIVAVAITANLAGLYQLPSLSFTRSGGKSNAFATGLLAAFIATPCTGPFMAAALGAALLLPWWQALLLFAALGFGLALPFLLLAFVPPLRNMLPRPGRWMETFRKILAIPMGLTALALLWLASRLAGTSFALVTAAIAVLFTLLLIFVERWRSSGRPALMPLLLGTAALTGLSAAVLPQSADSAHAQKPSVLDPIPYSKSALAEARAIGRPVFLWFTADWCLTCKINEQVAIEREATREAFEKAGVIVIRGDWTRRDPEITRFLTEHGAAGVPLYHWYPPGGDELVLPQLLAPDSLIALAERS